METIRGYRKHSHAAWASGYLAARGVTNRVVSTSATFTTLSGGSEHKIAVDENDTEEAIRLLDEAGDPSSLDDDSPAESDTMPVWPWLLAIAGLLYVIAHREDRDTRNGWFGSTWTLDRNGDGEADLKAGHDHAGRMTGYQADDNFDGQFDFRSRFEDNVVVESDRDPDFDGDFDIHTVFRHGVAETSELRPDGDTRPPLRRWRYDNGVLISEEYDKDRDGKIDQVERFSPFGEAVSIVPTPTK
ncbi:MAG: hypothetical protein KDM91_17810 [Verrucomicrobiae bacterium]|nr:hypothetical protein [Verrucomicrobiae bacterium]MCP5540350.1 hypothetical protein [Akkermansiaceae bacterium]MCP5550728.1 hypothetical protein [Akkermansiaceae bacterium]